MSKKMPLRIKKNFVYRKVWNRVYEQDNNATFIVLGDTGSGKSSVAIKMASDIDPSFDASRVCYDIDTFEKLAFNLKPGQAIVFDELAGSEEGADARSALSKANKRLGYIATTFRARRLVVFYVAPFLKQIDSNIRVVGVLGILIMEGIDRVRNLARVDFRWTDNNVISGLQYRKKPRVHLGGGVCRKIRQVWIPRPPRDLERSYKRTKMAFLAEQKKVAEERVKYRPKKMTIKQCVQKILRNRDDYVVGGRVHHTRIMAEFNFGENKARNLAKLVEAEKK